MANEPENIVLVYLRRLDGKVDGLREEMREIKERLHSLERQVAGVRVDFAHMREDLVRVDQAAR